MLKVLSGQPRLLKLQLHIKIGLFYQEFGHKIIHSLYNESLNYESIIVAFFCRVLYVNFELILIFGKLLQRSEINGRLRINLNARSHAWLSRQLFQGWLICFWSQPTNNCKHKLFCLSSCHQWLSSWRLKPSHTDKRLIPLLAMQQ